MTIVGYFLWERGLRGPCPVKIGSNRDQYLSGPEWQERTLSSLKPLDDAEFAEPLDVLARRYPLPE